MNVLSWQFRRIRGSKTRRTVVRVRTIETSERRRVGLLRVGVQVFPASAGGVLELHAEALVVELTGTGWIHEARTRGKGIKKADKHTLNATVGSVPPGRK